MYSKCSENKTNLGRSRKSFALNSPGVDDTWSPHVGGFTMRRIRLHPLFNEDGAIGASSGVESASAAETQETPNVDTSESGADIEVAAEPEKLNNFEKAFAKRLAAEREKWQSETTEKYKDYDTHKELSEYFQQINGTDAMSLKDRIEMERLQEKAEANNISPEMQKRLDALEAKAEKAEQLEQKQQEVERVNTYFSALNDFVKDKGVDSEALNQFMIDNEMQYNPNAMEKSFSLALKAFKADEAMTKLETAKKDAIDEYLNSKKAPRVEGSGAAGTQSVDTSKMSWKELQKHAVSRLEAAKTPQ
jgi:hypothetical protein